MKAHILRSALPHVNLTHGLTRDVWTALENGPVPIVGKFNSVDIGQFIFKYSKLIRSRSYIPDTILGYIGIQKGCGVTRFIPIISHIDLAIYYHLCGNVGSHVLKVTPGVFGGWRSISATDYISQEQSSTPEGGKLHDYGQYFPSSLSKSKWFEDFRNFNLYINIMINDISVGPYVVQTDIANFYDSIEIPKIIKKLRRDAASLTDDIELLEIFLSLWNRRTTGYQPSSKGIPQEIVSDGSRFLSHYYLQDFDSQIIAYCNSNGLHYVRWADDIFIFGPSKRSLERATHWSSRLLLQEGLNLSASKTRIFSKSEFAKNRAIDLLSAIDSGDEKAFRTKLRSVERHMRAGFPVKKDTVFRSVLGFTHRLGTSSQNYERKFLSSIALSDPDIIGSLTDAQLLRLIQVSDIKEDMFRLIVNHCVRRPFTGAQANLLTLLRLKSKELDSVGISKKMMQGAIKSLAKSPYDSEIIKGICCKSANEVIDRML